MEAEYRRDYHRNYLILHERTELDLEAYQVRMLLANVIPCLLPCRQQNLDGEPYFYFDITSKQAVSVCYEKQKLQESDLELLLSGIVRAAEQMAAFLMNPDQLCLEPEYMYLDLEKKQLYFCCFPARNVAFQDQFRSFMEYLLPKIEHKDQRAVTIGYGVYRRAMEEEFHLEQVLEELYVKKREEETGKQENSEKEKAEEGFRKEELRGGETEKNGSASKWQGWEEQKQGAEKEEEEEQKESRAQKGILLGLLSGAAVFTGLSVARGLGYFPEWNGQLLIGGLLLMGSLGIFLGFLWKKKEKKKTAPVLPLKQELLFSEEEKQAMEDDSEGRTMIIRRIQEPEKAEKNSEEKGTSACLMEYSLGITEDLLRPSVRKPPVLKNIAPGNLEEICLKEELTVIGKLPSASDVILPISHVSRIHAKIQKKEEHYYLTDLNSRNGTFVNEELLKGEEERELKAGDEIRFGGVVYVFEEERSL